MTGDSLLFAAGAFSTPGSPLSFPFVLGIFLVAAILGDAVNYAIGSYLGTTSQLSAKYGTCLSEVCHIITTASTSLPSD